MSKRVACLSIALSVLFTCSDAFAEAKNEEIVRHPSLLMVDDFMQMVGLGYSYLAHSNNGVSTSAHSFFESYGVSTTGALYDPEWVTLQLGAGLTYQQELNDTTGTSLNLQYNILATLFYNSYHPTLVTSSRTTTVVSDGYNPSYTLTRNSNQIFGSLQNSLVPMNYFYAHSTLETDRKVGNSSSSSDSFGIGFHHNLRDVSSSDLTFNMDSDDSQGVTSRSYSSYFSNSLTLDPKNRYRLSTSAGIGDTKSGLAPQRTATVSESLTARLGEALNANVSDQYSYSSTTGFDGSDQTITSNTIGGSLSHRLYRSLTTVVSGSYSEAHALGGKQNNYGGAVGLVYVKLLPGLSSLSLSGNLARNISEQNFANSQVQVPNEEHLVSAQGDQIALDFSGQLVTVQSVTSTVPAMTYVEGIDYRVNTATGKVEILIGGGIAPNTTIFISYTGQVNRKLRFQTDLANATALLSMKNGRYVVGANYSENSQTALSGEATEQGLVRSRVFDLRGSVNYANLSYGAEFTYTDSTQETLTQYGAFWDRTTHWTDADTVRLYLRDTYTRYGGSETSRPYDLNVISATGTYNRSLYNWLRLALGLNLSDSRRAGSATEVVIFRGGIDGTIRQLTYSLHLQTAYRVSGPFESRDDSLQFTLTRYF